MPRFYLKAVAPNPPERQDLLEPAGWPIYQQELVDAFITASLARAGSSAAGTAQSALKAHLVPWLSQRDKYVWEAAFADLDAFTVMLRAQLRATTASGYIGAVAWFYDWLHDRHGLELRRRLGITLVDPIDRFSKGARAAHEELVPVPREEAIGFFLAYAKDAVLGAPSDVKWFQASRNYAMWLVANWAGLRRAELIALVGADVDLDSGLITVRSGKGGRGRTVHIQPALVRLLHWYLEDVRPQGCAWRNSEPYFVSCRRCRFSEGGLARLLEREIARAGLAGEDRFTLHGFRRAFATRLYKQLRAEKVRDLLVYVQYELGHRYLSTTQHYCQLDDTYKAALAREAGVALVNRYRRRDDDP